MNCFSPSLTEPRSSDKSKVQSKVKSQRNPRSTPSRSRKRFDPQRRLEVAETRRNGACARCREKKVRCSPAHNKLPAAGTPQKLSETPSDSCRGSGDQGWANNTDSWTNDKNQSSEDYTGFEVCLKGAREHLKVGQSNVEECPRLVESWECAQKHSAGSLSYNNRTGIPQVNGPDLNNQRPQSSHSSLTIVSGGDISNSDSHPTQKKQVNKCPSDVLKSVRIFKDQVLVSPTSRTTARPDKTVLSTKDQNLRLHSNSDPINITVYRLPQKEVQNFPRRIRRSRLRGENAPWVALAPVETSQNPRRRQTPRPQNQLDERIFYEESHSRMTQQNLSCSIDFSPTPFSNGSDISSSVVEGMVPGFSDTELPNSSHTNFWQAYQSMNLPMAITSPSDGFIGDQDLSKPFESIQSAATNDGIEVYDNKMESQFHLGIGLDRDQDSDYPFASSFVVSAAPTTGLKEVPFNHLIATPGSNGQSTWQNTSQHGSAFNPNVNHMSSFSETSFQTPSNSLSFPSLRSTPMSSFSQGVVPVTPQVSAYTPSRKPSGRWQRLRTFRNPNREQ